MGGFVHRYESEILGVEGACSLCRIVVAAWSSYGVGEEGEEKLTGGSVALSDWWDLWSWQVQSCVCSHWRRESFC
jgi:hypothetical protein